MRRAWRGIRSLTGRAAGRLWAKRRWWPLALVLILFASAGPVARRVVRRRQAVAVVNNRVITVSEVVEKVKQSPDVYREYIAEKPQVIVDDSVNQVLLAQAARFHAWRYRRRLNELMRQKYEELLVKEFVEQEIVRKITVTDEEVNNYYTSHLAEFVLPERYRLHEIVVATEQDAEGIVKRLSLGESFEQIAARESRGASGSQGGDLGWIDKEKLDPALAALVARLRPGDILGKIIETDLGYHIVKLAAFDPSRVQSLQEAAPAIRNIFVTVRKREAVEAYIQQLRRRSRITISEENLELVKEQLQ